MLALGRLITKHDDGATIGYGDVEANNVVVAAFDWTLALLQAMDIDDDGFDVNDDVEFDIFAEPINKSPLAADTFIWFSSGLVAFKTANCLELPSSNRRCKPLTFLCLRDEFFFFVFKVVYVFILLWIKKAHKVI